MKSWLARPSVIARCAPAWDEAIIDPEIRSQQRALGSCAKILDRAELDLHLARFRHGRIGAVEWSIGLGLAAPESNPRRSKGRCGSEALHEAGRNTQTAAGSLDAARTATNSRSRSGTNSDVRAPGTVGRRASRR